MLPVAIHLHRHLVSGTADALRADFDLGLNVADSLREDVDWLDVLDLFLHDIEPLIEHAVASALLAVMHQAIDELRRQQRAIAQDQERVSYGWQ